MINTKGWTQVDRQEFVNFVHGKIIVDTDSSGTTGDVISIVTTFHDGSKVHYIENLTAIVRTCQHFIKKEVDND
jgi:hypothetical protein